MHSIFPHLQKEYQFWEEKIISDPFSGEHSLGILDVLRGHYLLVDYFIREGESIAVSGPRDLNLLISAVSRQSVGLGTKDKWTTPYEKAATLFFGLNKNHPFHDGNKRTALLSTLFFLKKNTILPTATEKEFEELAVRTAANDLKKYSQYERFKGHPDAQVRFLAYFFKRHSRLQDKAFYEITFNQLNTILKRYGFELENPDRNFIDIVKNEQENHGIIFKSKRNVKRKIGEISFTGWTKKVQVKPLNKVRQLTKLTSENGYDSQSFFREADPMEVIIAKYHRVLKRLKDK